MQGLLILRKIVSVPFEEHILLIFGGIIIVNIF